MENPGSVGRERAALVGNGAFRRLWVAQFATVILIYGLGLAGTVLVEERTQSSAQTGLIIVSSILPAFLTSLVSGAVVDRWGRKRLLIVSHVTRGLVALVFWAGATFLSAGALLVSIYGANLATAAFSQFATPSELAMLPDLVEKPQLPAANGLLQMGMLAGEGLGIVVLSPLLIKIYGVPSVGLMGAGLCLLATILVWSLPGDAPRAGTPGAALQTDLWADMRAGWRTIVRDRALALVAIQATVAAALLLILLSLLPGLLSRHMGLGVEDAPFMLLPGGLGFVAGLYWVGRQRERLRPQRTITAGLLGLGVSILVLAQLTTNGGGIWVALPAVLGLGLALGGIIVPARVVLQRRPPPAMRGRVIATQMALANAAAVVPLLLGGALADQWGIRPVMLGLGLAALAAGAAGLFLLRSGNGDY
jgi:DHA3 family macrolide efflux protein-like MFS transporter